uniref:Nucleoside-diphosphatase mig-23 n=1 Tax=Meloidogyne hapla TaxID=6305 RepID=A0A1I8B4H1_MELHA
MGSEHLNYGIIIDAGSTGSRLFLYEWFSKSDKQLIDIKIVNDSEGKPVVKKATPGLSTFADKPDAASDYLLPLLQYASKRIPSHKRSKTPLFIFATAGMRLLPLEKQNLIITNLRKKLPQIIELEINPENIKVITGKWEGIYSWIAVNYMLGRFNITNISDSLIMSTQFGNNDKFVNERPKTAGMIDMGGASTQIAFELPFDLNEQYNSKEEENIQIIQLGSKQFLYKIFVTTFLGFGVNEGAKKYEKLLWSKIRKNNSSSSEKEINFILDGCLPKDFLKLTSIEDDDGQFVRKGDGQWDNCVQNIATLIFDKYKECPKTKKCFFGGVNIPKGISLSNVELYGFSEYWFSVDDVLSLGGIYDHDIFEEKAKQFCKQTWREIKKKVRAKQYPKADRDRIETQCFKSAWIHAILHNGFYVEEKRNNFQSAFKIKGQEVQWALGAMIYQMRDFPAKASGSIELRLNNNQLLSNYTWIILYLFSFIIVIAFIWKTYQIRRKQLNGNNRLYRYRRLERQLTQNMA